MNKESFVKALASIKPSSTFLQVNKYKNAFGEISNYNIVFHISYENSLKKSILLLEKIIPESDVQQQAKEELLLSFNNSLNNLSIKKLEEIDDAYHHFIENGQYVKGVKIHKETNTLHIYGFVHSKQILIPGNYKSINSSELTIQKNNLKKSLPLSKWRQFKMLPEQVESIVVQKLTILPPEE